MPKLKAGRVPPGIRRQAAGPLRVRVQVVHHLPAQKDHHVHAQEGGGDSDIAYALFSFTSLAAYEQYRSESVSAPECREAFELARETQREQPIRSARLHRPKDRRHTGGEHGPTRASAPLDPGTEDAAGPPRPAA
ncbi:hypothetical protein [Streptomyces sp. NPDC017260]|uniref:hypothetical protein n=1 Tax=unclassified Streptomyces TaxID=2593676 RepID=UPI00379D38BF